MSIFIKGSRIIIVIKHPKIFEPHIQKLPSQILTDTKTIQTITSTKIINNNAINTCNDLGSFLDFNECKPDISDKEIFLL